MSIVLKLAGNRTIETDLPAIIMGILNVTPDSFWENNRVQSVEQGLEKALAMEKEGADIIDIGGESSRPGSLYIDSGEEISRVIPLIREIRKYSAIPLSVDTRKAVVLQAAIDAGADMCNDISALEDDCDIAAIVANLGIPVVLMHKKGVPETMQKDPHYADVVREVADYLLERARFAEGVGIDREKIIIDPGVGFGKTYGDNCTLISGLAEIVSLGYPVLMALSRKSCIGKMTGRETSDRLYGTLAANLVSVQNGARILRVHDVGPTRDSLAVLREIHTRGIY